MGSAGNSFQANPEYPQCSMYGMFTNISNISPKIDPNVGKYSIHGHGAYGYAKLGFCIIFPPQLELFNPINSAKAHSDANL
jgi:hypothetical protein